MQQLNVTYKRQSTLLSAIKLHCSCAFVLYLLIVLHWKEKQVYTLKQQNTTRNTISITSHCF